MKRSIMMMLAAGMAAFTLQAQAPSGMAAEVKQAYNGIKNNLTKAADKMPEDGYSFKATAEVRNFGMEVAHVADAQMGTCSRLNGAAKTLGAASKTSKADLVAALKDSFAECDKAYDSLTDANAGEMIAGGRGQRSRLGTLVGNTTHDNEMYGAMAVYLRLKGIVPPSSEGR